MRRRYVSRRQPLADRLRLRRRSRGSAQRGGHEPVSHASGRTGKLFYSLLPPEQLYLCPQGRHELYIVFPDCSDTQLRSFCFDCVSTARKLLGKTLYLGVSENSRPLCELQDALAQAHRALQDRFYDQQEVHFSGMCRPSAHRRTPRTSRRSATHSKAPICRRRRRLLSIF